MNEPVAHEAVEIRVHGRGGQGGVTCAKIIAAIHARMGKSVQTFGDYAGERSGAPVRAFTRIDDRPITNRNKVNTPDHLLVLDPTLLGPEIVAGLKPGGILALNTSKPLEAFAGMFESFRLAVVDATEIARRHGIGTKSVVIVNTTIAGAFARLLDLPLDAIDATYHHLGFASNLPAAREAFAAVKWRDPVNGSATAGNKPAARAALPTVVPLTEHLVGPPSGLKTGSWRTQEPRHVEHLAPCNAWCPAGNDVVGFVQAIATHGAAAAAEILAASTPLAGVCGHVCPAPCMEGCNRREYDGAVHIRGLERWVAEHAPIAAKPAAPVPPAVQSRRVAIVGGGPAGISAAYALVRAGHRPTIFDGEKALGGVLRTGIPEFRLPRAVIDREIDALLALGVETRLGEFLDRARIVALTTEFDAVILATGLRSLRRLSAPGATLTGVQQGIDFLHQVNLAGNVKCTGHVVVLGGGNTAIDCARAALRCGAEKVTIAYRRTRAEMPAIHEEIEEAEAEGIALMFQVQPVGFAGPSRVLGVDLAAVDMGPPDQDGRRSPVVTDRVTRLPCDAALLALGQSPDLTLVPEGWTLREGRFHAGETPIHAFAAGDFSTGDGTVTHALGDGRRAAGRVLQALGENVVPFARPDRATAVPVTDIRLDHFARCAPARERIEPATTRAHSFALVNHGLPDRLESHRCFSCGHCTTCDTCLVYCPEGILRRHDGAYEVDYTYCKGCGICVHECPRKAMEMTPL